jgi:hypothetical protein
MEREISWIKKLDIWIVSCGGVGSNYICDLLYDNGLKVNCRAGDNGHGRITHLNKKIVPLKNCIYVYGDYEWAIKSQERRGIFNANKKKLKKFYNRVVPRDDPLLYKYQYNNFKDTENTYLLKYPYTKDDLLKCFKFFNLDIDENKIEIKTRTTDDNFTTQYQNEIDIYNKFLM